MTKPLPGVESDTTAVMSRSVADAPSGTLNTGDPARNRPPGPEMVAVVAAAVVVTEPPLTISKPAATETPPPLSVRAPMSSDAPSRR